MAYGIVGPGIFSETANHGANTYIQKLITSSNSGILKQVDVQSAKSATIKIKIFRDDGTNYNFIGEQSVSVEVGVNTIALNIPGVIKGDLIANYSATSDVFHHRSATGGRSYKSGDITGNSAKTTWSSDNNEHALKGYVFHSIAPLES